MNSRMWLRMKAPPDGPDKYGRMPPIASYVTDEAGSQIIGDWIAGLSGPCPDSTM